MRIRSTTPGDERAPGDRAAAQFIYQGDIEVVRFRPHLQIRFYHDHEAALATIELPLMPTQWDMWMLSVRNAGGGV